ncbi:type IV pilus modification PilV family protein [Desulfobulbus propionicus]
MQQSMTPIRSQRGFTLLEVTMALAVLGIGIMSIVALQTRDAMYNNSSRRQTLAYTCAMGVMEYLRSLPSTDSQLNPGTYSEDDLEINKDCKDPACKYEPWKIDNIKVYSIKWTVVQNADVVNTKKIDLEIYLESEKNKSGAKPKSTITFTRSNASI